MDIKLTSAKSTVIYIYSYWPTPILVHSTRVSAVKCHRVVQTENVMARHLS